MDTSERGKIRPMDVHSIGVPVALKLKTTVSSAVCFCPEVDMDHLAGSDKIC